MENYNSESRYSDDESHESNSSDSDSPTRRVALPASALHSMGLGSHAEALKPPVQPARFEDVFAAEQQRRHQQEALRSEHEQHEKHDDEDVEKDDSTDSVAAPVVAHKPQQALPQPPVELALSAHASEASEAQQDSEIELPVEVPPAAPAEMSGEDFDEQFKQIVEVNLHDLQELDIPVSEREPYNLDPSVTQAAEVQPFPPAARPEVSPPVVPTPAAEQTPVESSDDFAKWENELSNNAQPPVPNIPPQGPSPSQESYNTPSQGQAPEAQNGTGGGGNVPPTPPSGPSMEMPGASPSPEPANTTSAHYNMLRQAVPHFGESLATALSTAEVLAINSKLQRAEFARRRGDAVTGLIAGWALVRTFRNRKMIRNDRRENKAAFQKQEAAIVSASEKNTLLQQRLYRAEQQQVIQQAQPNRFRPVAEASTANVAPSPIANTPEAQAARLKVAEKARLVQDQHEEALRQQTMEALPEHELVRPQWLTVEVDKQTGKAVERPTSFDYGEAFKDEQRREQMRDKVADTSTMQSQQVAGGVAGFLGTDSPTPTPMQQTPYQDPQMPRAFGSLPPIMPMAPSSKKEAAKSAGQQVSNAVRSPWFWLAIITLLIVFFSAAWF